MSYDDVLRLSLERGIFLPSCEIYPDAPAGFWEYGPLGVAIRNRYAELWRRFLVRRDGMFEIDGSQIMSKSVFVASGHLESFVDPIVECSGCGSIFRADRLIAEKTGRIVPERLSDDEFNRLIHQSDLKCPNCGGRLGDVRKFNMMFRVGVGPGGDDAYLRPETCQSIFVDFPRLFKIMRCKLPVAFAQFGKSFRNEISPRQSLMRLREFYQAEIEVFFNPDTADSFERYEMVRDYPLKLWSEDRVEELSCSEALEKGIILNRLIAYYLAILQQFYEKTGIDMERARFRELGSDERAFYAEFAFDFEVQTSLGWIELVACNYRRDYDLSRHSAVSKKEIVVDDRGGKVLPHIFELSMGVDRSIYCILEHSFKKEKERDLLKIRPYLAPRQIGVYPLVTKNGLVEKAQRIYESLQMNFDTFYDDSGSIGRRYRRADEIGVPFCITVDYQTLEDDTVTIRDRDSMNQDRIVVHDLEDYLEKRLKPL